MALLALFLGHVNIPQCPRPAFYLWLMCQYIKQGVHNDFADSAKNISMKSMINCTKSIK